VWPATEASGRERQTSARARAAQASAETLATFTRWDGDVAHTDILSTLASTVTRPQDLLVFVTDSFEVAIRMQTLIKLSRLERIDLTAFVDAQGLHVRWTGGGLNLRPLVDRLAARVTFPLPARVATAA
jgi:hypothetical protein